MIILKKNFEDKDTYIIGKYIKNGCQTFKIEDLDKVCAEYRVPDSIKESVRNAYYENSKTEEDYASLCDNTEFRIRTLVAKNGECLDKLVNDPHWSVRTEVAKQSYGLENLVNDPYWSVRAEVAKQSYGLERLVNDYHWSVKAEVARQGYGLDKLVDDPDWYVRLNVAMQGYGLDKLVNDNNTCVSSAASKLLNELNNELR